MTTRRTVLAGAASVAALGGLAILRKTDDPRRVVNVVPGRWTREGAGVTLRRTLGGPYLPLLDPFLLLDDFSSDDPADYLAGFPDHPHRGFETVTILLDGVVDHHDSVGNRGHLTPGGLQWMTAGRGIVHAEMPKPGDDGRRLVGLQLWVNLPAARKWDPPRYQDHVASDVPEVDLADARARVLAGSAGGRPGPIDGVVVQPTVLDVTLPAGGALDVALPGGHTAFLYALTGSIAVGPAQDPVPERSLAVLSRGTRLQATGAGRFLVVAGAPIGEPVARRGPFVMNTEAELDQAFADYRSGRLVSG
jgi:redox-sensitive bicupin YhaK (pirin superfamily)